MRSAEELFDELCALDESTSIEAKTGSRVDRSILETICAFANEPGLGGGTLLLGVEPTSEPDASPRYRVCGVGDPERVQAEIATQCATTFNRPVRPVVRAEKLNEKAVIVVRVDEAAPADKPIFVKSLGLPRGAFRRFGPTDQEGTDDDLAALYQGHQVDTYDQSPIRDAEISDLDPEALRAYRVERARSSDGAEELRWSDEELLRSLHAAVWVDGVLRPTVAGLLLFGSSKALRRCFPMMRVDYVRLPGRRWVEDPHAPFDVIEIRAPLMLAIPRAIAAIMDDLPTTFSLPEGELVRRDRSLLPIRVVREVIVNAVMHRSYRIHGPIQILRYANRLEIRNPGHSLKSPDQLGEPGSRCRNPRIAAVLHDLRFAESKGSGIRVMRDLMREHGLEPPAFESAPQPDQFVATFLFHHFLDEGDLAWLRRLTDQPLSDEEARALVFVREVGAIDNGVFRSFGRSDTLTASARLRRLRDLGLLEMRGSGNRTYYVASPRMTAAAPGVVGNGPHPPAETHNLGTETHNLGAETHNPQGDVVTTSIPAEIRARIVAAGRRPSQATLRALIFELCRHRPSSSREIAEVLGRKDSRELTRLHLRPMLDAGQLVYTIPKMPNHPDQKYALPTDARE